MHLLKWLHQSALVEGLVFGQESGAYATGASMQEDFTVANSADILRETEEVVRARRA